MQDHGVATPAVYWLAPWPHTDCGPMSPRMREPIQGKPACPNVMRTMSPEAPSLSSSLSVASNPSPLPHRAGPSVWLTSFLPNGSCNTDWAFQVLLPLRVWLLDYVHLFFFILYLLFTQGSIPVFLPENSQSFLALEEEFLSVFKNTYYCVFPSQCIRELQLSLL